MTSIRERMQIVLWALLILFLLSMTIGGLVGGANIIDQLFGKVNPQTTIASINGQHISPDRFNNIVNQQLQNARSGGKTISDLQIQRARKTAWDNLLQDVLVAQEVEKLKITASNEEVMWHLENNPPPFLTQNPNFKTDDVFDMNKYRQALNNPQGDEWAPTELFMKNTYIPNYKLQKMIDESIIITPNDLKVEFIKRNTKFTITGAHVTNATVAKSEAKVTPDEVRSEFDRTKNDHTHNGLRSISYVLWKKQPSKADTNTALKLSIELYNRATSGQNFEQLANEFSMDPSNQNSRGGDLGWFKKGKMVKPFDDAAFNAKKGQILKPIQTNFGYHLIYVRDTRLDQNGEKEVLASHILTKIEISSFTLSKLKKEATLFSYDAIDFGYDKALDENGFESLSHQRFDNNGYSIPGIGGVRAAIRFAFNSKPNEISDIIENEEYFVVCKLDSIFPPGIKYFKEVKTQIENRLNREKTKQSTLNEANNLLIKLTTRDMELKELIEDEKNLDGFKNESKTLLDGFTSIGRSNFVNGALLNAEVGDLLGPLETNRGQAIIYLIDIEDFDSTKFKEQESKLRELIFSRKQSQFFQAWIDELKASADIIDNRKYYF